MFAVYEVSLKSNTDKVNISDVKVKLLTAFSTQSEASKCMRLMNKKNKTDLVEYRYAKITPAYVYAE